VRERLGVLCDQVARHASMEGVIRSAAAGAELDRVFAALRGEVEIDARELGRLLDAIDDACAGVGLAPVTVRGSGYTPLPAGMTQVDPEPEPVKWGCPLGRCGRLVYTEGATSPPVCAAAGGEGLTEVRILR
jgi:hypothetical protein